MSKLKLNYRQKHNLPNILKSIKKGELGITKIAKKFNTSPQTLKKIAKAHNLEIADKRRVSRADKKRNDKIIELLTTQKYTYEQIGEKYGVTPQRIQQIALEFGDLKLHDLNHKKKEEIVKQIISDTYTLTYEQIKDKYNNFEGFTWNILKKKFTELCGIGIWEIMYKKRNQTVLAKYSSGEIAKEVS